MTSLGIKMKWLGSVKEQWQSSLANHDIENSSYFVKTHLIEFSNPKKHIYDLDTDNTILDQLVPAKTNASQELLGKNSQLAVAVLILYGKLVTFIPAYSLLISQLG